MPTCSVAECKHTNSSTKGSTIKYHVLPKDESVRTVWFDRCQIGDHVNVANVRVCSAHFAEDDYKRDMEHELLGLQPRRHLKPTAIPSLNLPSSTFQAHDRLHWPLRGDYGLESKDNGSTIALTDGQAREHAKGIMKGALERLNAVSSIEPVQDVSSAIADCLRAESDRAHKELAIVKVKHERVVMENVKLGRENDRLKAKVTMFKHANEVLKKKLARAGEVLNATISAKRKKEAMLENRCALVEARLGKKCAQLQSELDRYMVTTYLERDAQKLLKPLKKLGEKSIPIRRTRKEITLKDTTSETRHETNGHRMDDGDGVSDEAIVAIEMLFIPE